MKTLEENRYKKTYNSDARRVSWLVNNNLSEDYDTMPVSMKKKWSKAAYGRERYLAKEYLKHLQNLHETSAFFGGVDEVINDNYKLKEKETISIIPPIGGG